MATLADLRKRLRGIQTICQLAGAMRSVSSAKLARLKNAVNSFRPYAQSCRELLEASGAVILPADGGKERTLIILLSGNRGLCGSYHNELFSFFRSLPESEDACFITGGNMAAIHLRERGIQIEASFQISDVPEFSQAEALSERILAMYTSGLVSRVLVVYSEAVNAMKQTPKCLELLPGEASGKEQELILVPDAETAHQGLAEFCLRAQVYYLLLNSAMGVQGATLSSMRSAYDNGKATAGELETAINRLRQSKVTTSVIETSTGFWLEEEGK